MHKKFLTYKNNSPIINKIYRIGTSETSPRIHKHTVTAIVSRVKFSYLVHKLDADDHSQAAAIAQLCEDSILTEPERRVPHHLLYCGVHRGVSLLNGIAHSQAFKVKRNRQ